MKQTIEIFVKGASVGTVTHELVPMPRDVTATEPSIQIKINGHVPKLGPEFEKFEIAATGGKSDLAAFDDYMATRFAKWGSGGEYGNEVAAELKVPVSDLTVKLGPKTEGGGSGLGWGAAALVAAGLYWAFRRKKA